MGFFGILDFDFWDFWGGGREGSYNYGVGTLNVGSEWVGKRGGVNCCYSFYLLLLLLLLLRLNFHKLNIQYSTVPPPSVIGFNYLRKNLCMSCTP